MAGTKKPITQTAEPGVRWWLESLSKAALADIVVDLVRLNEGREDLDGPALVRALDRVSYPIMLARGDRLPSMQAWFARLRRNAKGSPTMTARVIAELERWL